MDKNTIEEKATALRAELLNKRIVSAGVGYDGVVFGWISLDDGSKMYLDKTEVENIIG